MAGADILLVDDDPNIRKLMRVYLEREHFQIHEAGDGQAAWDILQTQAMDLAVIDVMMPRMDGWELCQEIRREWDIPVLMVTAKGESSDKIKGFTLGTDDYLVKPFDPLELVMRVKALFKRYQIASSQTIALGSLRLDARKMEALINGEHISLPRKEFELLFKLASYPGQIFTRSQLIEQIWGIDYEGYDRTVDVHIKRLRERLSPYDLSFRIETVRGLGYRLVC